MLFYESLDVNWSPLQVNCYEVLTYLCILEFVWKDTYLSMVHVAYLVISWYDYWVERLMLRLSMGRIPTVVILPIVGWWIVLWKGKLLPLLLMRWDSYVPYSYWCHCAWSNSYSRLVLVYCLAGCRNMLMCKPLRLHWYCGELNCWFGIVPCALIWCCR